HPGIPARRMIEISATRIAAPKVTASAPGKQARGGRRRRDIGRTMLRWIATLLLVAACGASSVAPADPRQPAPAGSVRGAAIAHGGVGSSPDKADGCRAAVDAALAVLDAGGDPLDAAVAGVVVLEDDPRYNAGTGSRVRIDGE